LNHKIIALKETNIVRTLEIFRSQEYDQELVDSLRIKVKELKLAMGTVSYDNLYKFFSESHGDKAVNDLGEFSDNLILAIRGLKDSGEYDKDVFDFAKSISTTFLNEYAISKKVNSHINGKYSESVNYSDNLVESFFRLAVTAAYNHPDNASTMNDLNALKSVLGNSHISDGLLGSDDSNRYDSHWHYAAMKLIFEFQESNNIDSVPVYVKNKVDDSYEIKDYKFDDMVDFFDTTFNEWCFHLSKSEVLYVFKMFTERGHKDKAMKMIESLLKDNTELAIDVLSVISTNDSFVDRLVDHFRSNDKNGFGVYDMLDVLIKFAYKPELDQYTIDNKSFGVIRKVLLSHLQNMDVKDFELLTKFGELFDYPESVQNSNAYGIFANMVNSGIKQRISLSKQDIATELLSFIQKVCLENMTSENSNLGMLDTNVRAKAVAEADNIFNNIKNVEEIFTINNGKLTVKDYGELGYRLANIFKSTFANGFKSSGVFSKQVGSFIKGLDGYWSAKFDVEIAHAQADVEIDKGILKLISLYRHESHNLWEAVCENTSVGFKGLNFKGMAEYVDKQKSGANPFDSFLEDEHVYKSLWSSYVKSDMFDVEDTKQGFIKFLAFMHRTGNLSDAIKGFIGEFQDSEKTAA